MQSLTQQDKSLQVSSDEAFKLDQEIKQLRRGSIMDFWKMIHKLGKQREYRGWAVLDYESWESYLAQPEISYAPRTVEQYFETYISIYKYINNTNDLRAFDIVQLDPMAFGFDITRGILLKPYINDKLLEQAETLSYSDFLLEIEKLKPPVVIPPLPEGKYQVIYADPPWKYAQEQHSHEKQETVLETHYPTLETEKMCTMPVRDLVAENAVLFLWTTSPKLYEAKQLIDAWGFEYKATMIWDKVKHNVGYYVSVRHEILLICTKGSCLPDNPKLYDSVQTIERTEHSKKPEEFYKIIEDLYHGKKIELFAREKHEGWDVWGDEV